MRLTTDSPGVHVEDLRINLDGIDCCYQKAGSGPALVLVHGLMGYSFSWRHALPVLARQATVFAIDLPGTGHSDWSPNADYSLTASAERLLRFMDETGIASCDLLGTSHGGALAIMAATLAPQRVRRLILVAPANPWSAHGRYLVPFLRSRWIRPAFLQLAPRSRIFQEFFFRRMFGDTRRIRTGTVEGYLDRLRTRSSFEYAMSILRTWFDDMEKLRAKLPLIASIPTLLIWGDRDTAVDFASAAVLKTQFRECRLLTFEGVGHLPYEEAPEEFNRAVSLFLER